MRKTIGSLVGVAMLYVGLSAYGVYGQAVERQTERQQQPPAPMKFYGMITEAADTYDLHPALIAAVIQAESNFNPRAVSYRGAKGLMQIVPSTQRLLRIKNAYDPRQNIDGGSRYLRELLDLFRGNVSLAIAAYNAGPNAVARHAGIPPFKQTREYVRKVLAYYHIYRRSLGSAPLMS